jgi:hypothetical protein
MRRPACVVSGVAAFVDSYKPHAGSLPGSLRCLAARLLAMFRCAEPNIVLGEGRLGLLRSQPRRARGSRRAEEWPPMLGSARSHS